MAKREKQTASKADGYEAAMEIWFQQRNLEIESCRRAIKIHQRMIAFAQADIAHRRQGIRLEQQQIRLAVAGRADGRRNLAEYRRSKSRKAGKT